MSDSSSGSFGLDKAVTGVLPDMLFDLISRVVPGLAALYLFHTIVELYGLKNAPSIPAEFNRTILILFLAYPVGFALDVVATGVVYRVGNRLKVHPWFAGSQRLPYFLEMDKKWAWIRGQLGEIQKLQTKQMAEMRLFRNLAFISALAFIVPIGRTSWTFAFACAMVCYVSIFCWYEISKWQHRAWKESTRLG